MGNGWSDERSYLDACAKDASNEASLAAVTLCGGEGAGTAELLKIKGAYYVNDVEFQFSGVQQTTGKFLFRGRVSVISPVTGKILRLVPRIKKDSTGTGQDKTTSESDLAVTSKIKVGTEIHCNTLDLNDIKKAIEKGAMRLYQAYAPDIHRLQGMVARPDTITPAVAAIQYADDFLNACHRNLNRKSHESYHNKIVGACVALPHKAMSQYTKNTIKEFLGNTAVSQHTKALVRGFWGFCLTRKICDGSNPFPIPETRKMSPEAKRNQAKNSDELSFEQQDEMFKLLYPEHTGGDCGIALQLWGGFSAKVACSFNWGDLIFDPKRPDYVRVNYQLDDLAGATHNYIRPVLPTGALILTARYKSLLRKYSIQKLAKMPVVSLMQNPQKRMTANALVQLAAVKLRTIGIKNETFSKKKKGTNRTAVSRRILMNTYKKLVVVYCGLLDDPGTANFLQGLSLSNDVTSDHYTSFSSDEAGERLYTIVRATMPRFDIPQIVEHQQRSDGTEQYAYCPDNTRQRVGVVGEFLLNPGETAIIRCPHGVAGSLRARALSTDGKPRRKGRKKSE